MITIKKKHNLELSKEHNDILNTYITKYNNVLRYTYNRIVKDKINSVSLLERNVKDNMKNIDVLDASWIKAAVKSASELDTYNKLYFGGKGNFFKRKYKKIESYNKNHPISMRGSCSDPNGNRKGILKHDTFIFKPCKGIAIEIPLSLSKLETRMVGVISRECKEKKNYFNFKLDSEYVYISFEEPKLDVHTYVSNRFLGIDLNPNYVAISITDYRRGKVDILYKEIIDLTKLNIIDDKDIKKYEQSIMNKHIISLCKRYNVEYVCIEDLNIKSSDKGNGRYYNKLVNNKWNRKFVVDNLVKQLNVNDVKHLMVKAHYSSFIGQVKYINDYDSVAASIEVGYRGLLKIKGVSEWDYIKDFLGFELTTHWKEKLADLGCDATRYTFKDMYIFFNSKSKPKYSYRFLFSKKQKILRSSFTLNCNSLLDLFIV